MNDRARMLASTTGSLRLEGLESSPQMRALLERWARGEASNDDLREAERWLLAGEPLDDLEALAQRHA